MSKIVTAVNVMISCASMISGVLQNGSKLFFLYDDKYKWSLGYDDDTDNYYLFYYPGSEPIDRLAAMDFYEASYVSYSTETDLKTREAKESLAELYRILKEKIHGVDKVLDDIIDSSGCFDDPFADE